MSLTPGSANLGQVHGTNQTQAPDTLSGMSAALVRRNKVDSSLQENRQIVNAKSNIGVLKSEITIIKSDIESLKDKKMRGSTLGFINAMKNIGTFVSNTFTPGKPFMEGMLEWRQDQQSIKDQSKSHDKFGTTLNPLKYKMRANSESARKSNNSSIDKKEVEISGKTTTEWKGLSFTSKWFTVNKIPGKEGEIKALEKTLRGLHAKGDGIALNEETTANVNSTLEEHKTTKVGKLIGNSGLKEILRTHVGKEYSSENLDFITAMKDALGNKPGGDVSLTKMVAIFDAFVPTSSRRSVNVPSSTLNQTTAARNTFMANPTDENADRFVNSMLKAFGNITSVMNDSISRLEGDPKVGKKITAALDS